jgi:hypothetical protein
MLLLSHGCFSCDLLQAAAAEFAMLKKPTTMSEDMDEEQQQAAGSEEDEWEDEDDDEQPSYEFRFECAKMLLELDDTTETAIQVGLENRNKPYWRVPILVQAALPQSVLFSQGSVKHCIVSGCFYA